MTRPRPVVSADLDGWPAVRQEVFARDGGCIFEPSFRQRGKPLNGLVDHYCRNAYGHPIVWERVRDLAQAGELDHVKEELTLGAKAPDDSAHLVVVCFAAHHRGLATSRHGRDYERRWLASYYPEVWATFIARQQEARAMTEEKEHPNRGRSDEARDPNRPVDPETGEKEGLGPREGHEGEDEEATQPEEAGDGGVTEAPATESEPS